jgi:hypothetical protein
MDLQAVPNATPDSFEDRVFRHWTEQWHRVPPASAGMAVAIAFTASQLGPSAVRASGSLEVALVLAAVNLPAALLAAALPFAAAERFKQWLPFLLAFVAVTPLAAFACILQYLSFWIGIVAFVALLAGMLGIVIALRTPRHESVSADSPIDVAD